MRRLFWKLTKDRIITPGFSNNPSACGRGFSYILIHSRRLFARSERRQDRAAPPGPPDVPAQAGSCPRPPAVRRHGRPGGGRQGHVLVPGRGRQPVPEDPPGGPVHLPDQPPPLPAAQGGRQRRRLDHHEQLRVGRVELIVSQPGQENDGQIDCWSGNDGKIVCWSGKCWSNCLLVRKWWSNCLLVRKMMVKLIVGQKNDVQFDCWSGNDGQIDCWSGNDGQIDCWSRNDGQIDCWSEKWWSNCLLAGRESAFRVLQNLDQIDKDAHGATTLCHAVTFQSYWQHWPTIDYTPV